MWSDTRPPPPPRQTRRMWVLQKEQYYQFEFQMNQRLRHKREAEVAAASRR